MDSKFAERNYTVIEQGLAKSHFQQLFINIVDLSLNLFQSGVF